MKQNNFLTAIACTVLFFFCTNGRAQSTNSTLFAAKKAIAKTNAIYFDLYAKNDGSILNLYTADACLLAPNAMPICGREALKKDFEDTFAAGKVKGGKFNTLNVYGDGKTYVTEEGTFQIFGPNGKLLDEGKYLKLWKATKTGWKIFRDSFNSNHKVM